MTTAATTSPSDELKEIVSKVKDVSHVQKSPDRPRVKRVLISVQYEDGPPVDAILEGDEKHEILFTLYAKQEIARDGEKLLPTGQIDHEFGFYRRRK